MQELYKLSTYKQGNFYFLSNKIVRNETISNKNFFECSFQQIHFSDCIFTLTSFGATKCEYLTFERCIFQGVIFKKSELENYIFKNCQLDDIDFSRSELIDFDFMNCKLNGVWFCAGELTDIKFDHSQLQDVWFSGSSLDNLKIKDSTLEKIRFDGTKVVKETCENGIVTANRILIRDYPSFWQICVDNQEYDYLVYRSFKLLIFIIGLYIGLILFNI